MFSYERDHCEAFEQLCVIKLESTLLSQHRHARNPLCWFISTNLAPFLTLDTRQLPFGFFHPCPFDISGVCLGTDKQCEKSPLNSNIA